MQDIERIKIGLPKGVIKNNSLLVVKALFENETNLNKLSFINEKYAVYLMKHRDIPKMIEGDLLDIGITSSEWIEENQSEVDCITYLDWCDTKICLIKSQDENLSLEKHKNVNCITEFPYIAKEYFKQKGVQGRINYISGSSEACVPTLFEYCVDCVEKGITLKQNNLVVEEVIMKSKVVVIGKKCTTVLKSEINKLVDIIKSVNG